MDGSTDEQKLTSAIISNLHGVTLIDIKHSAYSKKYDIDDNCIGKTIIKILGELIIISHYNLYGSTISITKVPRNQVILHLKYI